MERIWVVVVLLSAIHSGGAQEAAPIQAADPIAEAANAGDAQEPETQVAPPKQVCYFAVSDWEADQRVYEVLASPIKSDGWMFTETPLEEVVNLLRDDYEIEIQLDDPALDDFGIDSSEPVNASIRSLPLGAALRLVLNRMGLTYVVSDRVVLITTQEEAETRLMIGIYPIADLLTGHIPTAGNNLVDTIISTVATETWAENGGGEAEIRLQSPGILVISTTSAVHQEIAALLGGLRVAQTQNPAHFLPVAKQEPKTTGGSMCGELNPANRGRMEPTPADQNNRSGGYGGGGGAVDGNPQAVEKKS
jgi:hypothetical protein